jgi:hypothetical protein
VSGLTIVGHAGPSPAQWDIVIRGMRNSWESWEKGNSTLVDGEFVFGSADRDLALRLVKLGSDHGKYLRQLPIIVDIKAPGYWWREFDTYRIGVEAADIVQNSTSMMHTLGREPVEASMFAFEDPESEAARPAWPPLQQHGKSGSKLASAKALRRPLGGNFSRSCRMPGCTCAPSR